MVITSLDDTLITSGKSLVSALDSTHVNIDAALWYYYPELNSWKLVLSLPEIVNEGPIFTYTTIQNTLLNSAISNLSLEDIILAKSDDKQLALLRSLIKTDQTIAGIKFSNNVFNGHLISDAYIYRMLAPKQKFIIYKDKAGEFRFKLVGARGRTILVSEGYTTKANAMNGVEFVKKNSIWAVTQE